jgi:hypothetical protein
LEKAGNQKDSKRGILLSHAIGFKIKERIKFTLVQMPVKYGHFSTGGYLLFQNLLTGKRNQLHLRVRKPPLQPNSEGDIPACDRG